MSQANQIYQKYDFILHPIKDLTKNWNVDISSVLSNYMDDVNKMTFTFNDGQTTLNFAEASMLIQGSTCVWSRKVEYLNSLVYQTLDIITKNKQDKQTSNEENQETEKNNEFEDSEDQFLDLTDLKLCTRKNMTEENDEEDLELLTKISTELFADSNDRGSLFYGELGEVVNYYSDFWSNHLSSLPTNSQIGPNPGLKQPPAVQKENEQTSNDYDIIEDDGGSFHDDDDNDDVDAGIEAFDEIIEEYVEEKQLRQRRVSCAPEVMSIVEQSRVPAVMLDEHSLCETWTPKPLFAPDGKTLKIPKSLNSNPRKRKREMAENKITFISDFFKKMKVKSMNYYESVKDAENRRLDQLWKVLKLSQTPSRRAGILQQDNCNFNEDNDNGDDEFGDNDNNDDLLDISDLVDSAQVVEGEQVSILNDIINSTGLSYEEQVLQYVKGFYKLANEQKKESELSQRVKDWESALVPFMKIENNRPEFDIHKYGDDVLRSFHNAGEKLYFRDINRKEEEWTICRRFSAILQLANDGNFLLQSEGDTTFSCVNTLTLKLVSSKHLRDRLNDYNHT